MIISATRAVFSIRGMEQRRIPRIEQTARVAEKIIQGAKRIGWFFLQGANSYFYTLVSIKECRFHGSLTYLT
jgi:hypothetical protein